VRRTPGSEFLSAVKPSLSRTAAAEPRWKEVGGNYVTTYQYGILSDYCQLFSGDDDEKSETAEKICG
jgi:hypothetical protein